MILSAENQIAVQEIMIEDGTAGELVDSVIEQILDLQKPFDYIGIRIATYEKKLNEGTLYIEFQKDYSAIAQKKYAASQLKDNEIIWLETKNSEPGAYRILVRTEGFPVGGAPTIYTSENSASQVNGNPATYGLAVQTANVVTCYSFGRITASLLFLTFSLLLLKNKVSKRIIRRMITIVSGLMFAGICTICFSSLLVTGYLSPSAFLRFCFLDEDKIVERVFDQLDDIKEISYKYRYDGTAYTQFISVWMPELNEEIYTVSIYLKTDTEKKGYDITFFSQNQNMYRKCNGSRIVYKGQNRAVLFPNVSYCENLRLDYGKTSTFEDLQSAENEQLIFDRIVVNEKNAISEIQSSIPKRILLVMTILMLSAIVVILCARNQIPKKSLDWQQKKGISNQVRFLVWGSCMGLVFLIWFPVFQAPDEGAHLLMIEKELGSSNIGTELSSVLKNLDIGRCINYEGEAIDIDKYLGGIWIPSGEKIQLGVPSYQIVRHLPQAIAIEIATLLDFPPFWIFILGRLGGLLFYLYVGCITIRIMPYAKEVLMVFMTSPMVMQQVTSLNYDCIVLSMSFLLLAFILYLKERNENWGWREALYLGLVLIPILMTKPNYSVIALLTILIPLEKWDFSIGNININRDTIRKHKPLVAILAVCATGIGLVLFSHLEVGKLLFGSLRAPVAFGCAFINSLVEKGGFYFHSTTARFGWLDAVAPTYFCVLIAGLWMFMTVTKPYSKNKQISHKLTLRRPFARITLLVAFFSGFVLCFIAMIPWTFTYLAVEMESTIDGIADQIGLINSIEGVQGRYFLPLIPLFLLAVQSDVPVTRERYYSIRVICQTIILFGSAAMLIKRYWII